MFIAEIGGLFPTKYRLLRQVSYVR